MEADGVLLAVKVANAETELGLFAGSELCSSWAITTQVPCTADELECSVISFLETRDLDDPGAAILCSVVPGATTPWAEALGRVAGRRPLVVGPGLKSGIAMEYKDPAQVGADRVALAVAARELYGAPVIVADCDAATSVSVVGREGTFLGGAIAAGIGLSLEALSGGAAQIAEVGFGLPKRTIGRTTADAVKAGVVLGEAARLDGLVAAMWDELGYETRIVVTGRHAALVAAASRHEATLRPDLALQGLRCIFALNG